jgi:hypothetical protein
LPRLFFVFRFSLFAFRSAMAKLAPEASAHHFV